MKLGIFGGAFDPPHKEHINICLAAIKELNLDKVILLPSGVQPHKTSETFAGMRAEMIRKAASIYDMLEVDELELNLVGTAYASDVLPLVQQKYGEFIYILGGDSLINIMSWHRPDLILTQYKIAVAIRGGRRDETLRQAEYLTKAYGADITILDYIADSISSTELRARLELSLNASLYVPDSVMKIIKDNGLYRSYSSIIDKLIKSVSEKTYLHSARTVIKALELNLELNLPYDQVFIAAALHDCMKKMPYNPIYKEDIPESAVDTPVMHAFMGAAVAQKEYGVSDRAVLDAIRYHTTGRADMSPLEKLIFLADTIEDGRDFEGVDQLRKAAQGNFEAGFILSVDLLYNHLKKKKTDIYPLTSECYNYYFNKEKE